MGRFVEGFRLYRHLKDQGQSLARIKDDLRKKHAAQLLRETSLTITEISEMLGYSEDSAFYRAFQNWFGTTPNKLRAQFANRGPRV